MGRPRNHPLRQSGRGSAGRWPGRASLGIAHGLGSSQAVSRKLAAGGFAAWGAWVGAFGGALVNREPHEVTLGGLAGAKIGALLGYGLLSQDWVKPRDFGWLSLFGSAGAVLGGGTGAFFFSTDNPRPVLAGLTIGPAVGITVGAFVLPRLHSLTRSNTVSFHNFGRRQVAGMSWQLGDATTPDAHSSDILAQRSAPASSVEPPTTWAMPSRSPSGPPTSAPCPRPQAIPPDQAR
jgi:hypothetical protein